jgi:hypothetical protein
MAEQARTALPQCNGRIDSAVKLLLSGDVKLLPDGTAHVGSRSDVDKMYVVHSGGCDCQDAQHHPEIQGWCAHKIARALFIRVRRHLAEPSPSHLEESPMPHMGSIPAQFLVALHGKMFVQYAGLLAMAHEKGLVNLSAHFISVDPSLALAEATAEFADGRTFKDCADATPENVNAKIRPHFPRLALTRAKARALRDALNIGMASVEELES